MMRYPKTARVGAMFAAALLLASCSPRGARVGVSPPPALLYRNITAPMGGGRGGGGERAGGGPPGGAAPAPPAMVIPDNLRRGTTRWYSVGLPNIPGVPGTTAISVGWGDGSTEKALENGKLGRFIYGDYREINVLFGTFNMIDIYAYGTPAEEGAGGPPPGVTGELPQAPPVGQ